MISVDTAEYESGDPCLRLEPKARCKVRPAPAFPLAPAHCDETAAAGGRFLFSAPDRYFLVFFSNSAIAFLRSSYSSQPKKQSLSSCPR